MTTRRRPPRQWLIAYDVPDARRRRRLAALLEGHAVRVQRSVFRADCPQTELVAVLSRAEEIVSDDDRLRAWPVVPAAAASAHWPRPGQSARMPQYWIV
jgi:CRISPR-associated protein Cas2